MFHLTLGFNLDESTQFADEFTECSSSGTEASMMTTKDWVMTTREVPEEGSKMEEVDFSMHAEFIEFGAVLSTSRVLLVAVRESSDRGWPSDDFLGPHVSDTGKRWRRRWESVPGVGPLAN